MGTRYPPQPHLDRLTMRNLGSALRPDYDPVVKSPLPESLRNLLLEYTVAEAVGEPQGRKLSRASETVPHLPR